MTGFLVSEPRADETIAEPVRLRDCPNWVYLLQDFYEFYRRLPSGGSAKIRTHQRAVRERISRVLKANPEMRGRAPASLPVTAHLQRALDQGRVERHGAFLRGLDSIREELVWLYGYEKVPKGLARKYAYAEIAGPTGPVLTDEVILGLVLFAPGCTYPAHAHDGITESYICLSGAISENDTGVFAPGSMIFNPPGHLHRITVADNTPALLSYAWVGDQAKLANQKMVFTRKK